MFESVIVNKADNNQFYKHDSVKKYIYLFYLPFLSFFVEFYYNF